MKIMKEKLGLKLYDNFKIKVKGFVSYRKPIFIVQRFEYVILKIEDAVYRIIFDFLHKSSHFILSKNYVLKKLRKLKIKITSS